DKKDKLTPLHRALLIKKDPVLFEMILYLGGNLNTYVKGKEFVPFYTISRIKEPKDLIKSFLNIYIKHKFNFNNKQNFNLYVENIEYFKYLINKGALSSEFAEEILDEYLEFIKDIQHADLEKRKLTLCKNIIKNYKRKKERL
ncbi:MAG: hypothetical protein ACRC45_05055, partial [Cetobacterium sp.]